MFYENELHFLQKMLTKSHLQNMVFSPNAIISESIGESLRSILDKENLNKTFYEIFPETMPRTVYRITDMFLCRYIFFELPFTEREQLLLVGPYFNTEITREAILEQGEKLGISPKHFKELEVFYSSIPVIKDEHLILAAINTFAEFIWDGKYDSQDLSRDTVAAFSPTFSESRNSSEESQFSIRVMEERYRFENELIDAVSKGNTHKAEAMLTSFSTLAFENRVSDPVRNIKNYCIIMNTLLRKAAENGGVHPIYLDRVSSDFAKRIEDISSLSSATDFMLNIMRTYCKLVKRHSLKNYSPLVQKAILRIETDLTTDLSLKELSKASNVSPGYFSALFKKETGQTLTDYVNAKRINHAKHLLTTTNLQIQTVAQHCGILDFHYFCRLFKKLTGETPSAYRLQNQSK